MRLESVLHDEAELGALADGIQETAEPADPQTDRRSAVARRTRQGHSPGHFLHVVRHAARTGRGLPAPVARRRNPRIHREHRERRAPDEQLAIVASFIPAGNGPRCRRRGDSMRRPRQSGAGRRPGADDDVPTAQHPAFRRTQDSAVEPLRAQARHLVRPVRQGLGQQSRGGRLGRPHQQRRHPGSDRGRDPVGVGSRPHSIHCPAGAVRAECARPARRHRGGGAAFRTAASVVSQIQLEPHHQQVLRVCAGLGARPRRLSRQHVAEGRPAERAVDLGRSCCRGAADKVRPAHARRHRHVPGAGLEHGRPGAAVVVRRSGAGYQRECRR